MGAGVDAGGVVGGGVLGGRGSHGGSVVGACGDGGGGVAAGGCGAGALVALNVDAELGGVWGEELALCRRDGGSPEQGRRTLVLAGHIVNELDAIAGSGREAGAKLAGNGPLEAAGVGDSLSDGLADGDHVGGGSLEEEQRDGVGRRGVPGDGEGLASLDSLEGLVSDYSSSIANAARCRDCFPNVPRSKDE